MRERGAVEVSPEPGSEDTWLVFERGDFFRKGEETPANESESLAEPFPILFCVVMNRPCIMECQPGSQFHRHRKQDHREAEQPERRAVEIILWQLRRSFLEDNDRILGCELLRQQIAADHGKQYKTCDRRDESNQGE